MSPSSSHRSGSKIHPRNPVFRPILIEPLQPEAIRLVRPLDRHAEIVRQPLGAPRVIDMAMRQQDLLDRHARLFDRRHDPRQVAARIDHRRLHRRGAPEERAVLLDRRDGHDRSAEGRICHGLEIG